MANRIWNIDGSETVASEGAVIKWEDHIFFTLSYNGQSFKGEILEEKTERNFLKLKINHRVFEIRKKGELDELISAMGLDVPKVRKLKELQAPMPGRIVNIAIVVGQELSVGDEILSLEAMKMENVLKAEGVGVVKAINYSNNDVVEKGAVIVEFE
ncbi:MAG: acetyl-CoA carboxylase biotin carboxyl carrier protein subunit [Crocinitomicaceae bacterium]|nr:acetyl-CoA carboxylase biotin carboxyl carrier protein subunit [Crocinitomicaceae bacterium]MDG1775868.1 acetyl-CoA carboxylase biotin carboxyl carrier protein subunit [Crocinitomicaceae bacterium]